MFIGSPPFTSTAMDFLGPYKVKAMNNARLFLMVWPVIFGCLNTGAVHIELNKTYRTNALLLSISEAIPPSSIPTEALSYVKLRSILTRKKIRSTGPGENSRKL